MSQSLVNNLVHLIYGAKDRRPWLVKEHRPALFAYQAAIFREWDCPALVVGGVEDHVHALFSLSKNHALKTIVEQVKKGSSKWMKSDGPHNPEFHWQTGYSAFSVSHSLAPAVAAYIENQEIHHHKRSFQDELREMFKKNDMPFDERYAWD